jgi:serine/threonine protein kinase/Tfp pilus assembly protein PilF
MQTDHATNFDACLEIDRYIAAFETACLAHKSVTIEDFAPASEHTLRDAIVCELIRVDLELRSERGEHPALEPYRRRFPSVFADSERVKKLEYELGRQCSASTLKREEATPTVETPWSNLRVGDDLFGFQLVQEIGRGSFSRVFLARQAELAGRQVALKVTTTPMQEPQFLAQLQHTNIVPIYSLHETAGCQVVCMPYFGSTTLADVMRSLADLPTVPVAGAHFVSTILARSESTRAGVDVAAVADPATMSPSPGLSQQNLDRWTRRSYVESVLWLGTRLAAGLAHAHGCGILHLDLKPANVLLTDVGEAMLLDFNLSRDLKRNASDGYNIVGGTLPYMAPEQLRNLQDGTTPVDHRADVYALGILFWQLLTGQPPSRASGESGEAQVTELLQTRLQPQPSVRELNRHVPWAVASIVQKCLAPRPEDRYSSAEALREDLECQLSDRPLRYAGEPSWRERAGKWRRRHPRLSSLSTVAAVALVLIASLAGLLWEWRNRLVVSQHRVAVATAQTELREFLRDKQEVEVLLQLSTPELDLRQEALAKGDQLLRHLQARGVAPGTAGLQPVLLSTADRDQFQTALRELALQLSQAHGDLAGHMANGVERLAHERLARQWTEFLSPSTSSAELAPPTSDADGLLLNALELAAVDPADALGPLQELVEREPSNYSAWFLRATCQYRMAAWSEAASSFSTCIALRPDFHWGYFGRGYARLTQSQYAEAERDFSHALRLRPDLWAARLNRAVARHGAGDLSGALVDLDAVVNADFAVARAMLLRSEIKARIGDQEGAARDRQIALSLTPRDEIGWIARGCAKLPDDPQGALADFHAALQRNSRSRDALHNQAHVYSEILNDPARAIESLDAVLEFEPRDVTARGARGVLRARSGDRTTAHEDAAACLALDAAPLTIYQVAGIFALTSSAEPADARESLRLLDMAFQLAPQLVEIAAGDRDLDLLRGQAAFEELMATAKRRAAASTSAGK